MGLSLLLLDWVPFNRGKGNNSYKSIKTNNCRIKSGMHKDLLTICAYILMSLSEVTSVLNSAL